MLDLRPLSKRFRVPQGQGTFLGLCGRVWVSEFIRLKHTKIWLCGRRALNRNGGVGQVCKGKCPSPQSHQTVSPSLSLPPRVCPYLLKSLLRKSALQAWADHSHLTLLQGVSLAGWATGSQGGEASAFPQADAVWRRMLHLGKMASVEVWDMDSAQGGTWADVPPAFSLYDSSLL